MVHKTSLLKSVPQQCGSRACLVVAVGRAQGGVQVPFGLHLLLQRAVAGLQAHVPERRCATARLDTLLRVSVQVHLLHDQLAEVPAHDPAE